MKRSTSSILGSLVTAGILAAAMPAGATPMQAGSTAADTSPATSVEVGGAPMMSDARIPENASKASNLTTLVAAVKAAGLIDTLNGDGPFTVFAPNKAMLTGILTYHVVAGKMTAADLAAAAKANGGMATVPTVAGGTLTVMEHNGGWAVKDENGGMAMIETADVMQANGVVHVIDGVLMPKPATKPM
jgi:uncharacterized surface protein with fasciclin (FAS1) repeats